MITDEQRGQFSAQMKAEAWVELKDIFGSVYGFENRNTKKRVKFDQAFTYWRMSGSAPVPF